MSAHRSWTPEETWLAIELARRLLVVRGSKGKRARPVALAEAAGPGDEAWVEHVRGEESELRLHLRGKRARVALDASGEHGERWRGAWVLVLWNGEGERWLLTPGSPEVEVEAQGQPVQGKLLRKRTTLRAQGPRGPVELPVEDRAFHRRTEQSSTILRPDRSIGWADPTEPEPDPRWRIDLGRSYYLPSVRLDLRGLPPGTTLKVRGCALLTRFDEMPPGAMLARSTIGAPAPPRRPGARPAGAIDEPTRVEVELGWVARHLQVELKGTDGAPLSLDLAGCEIPGVELWGATLRETLRRTMALFAGRPMFAERQGDDGPYRPSMTYAEVARRAELLTRALAARLEGKGAGRVVIALLTRNRPEWVMADMAAIERGYVVAPLSPDEPDDRIASILQRCSPAMALIEAGQEARFEALARGCPSLALLAVCGAPADLRAGGHPAVVSLEALLDEGDRREALDTVTYSQDDLYSLLFTSGSTGMPKGVMRSYASFFAMMRGYGVPQPSRHLSFMPLGHSSERMYQPTIYMHGGVVAFSRGGARLPDELRAFEPTELGSVPRLFDLLYAAHERDIKAGLSKRQAWENARYAYGNRLELLSVGSAPVRPEVLEFLRATFADLWVTEGYGTTEVGSISGDGQLVSDAQIKIVPVPGDEAGSEKRGELLVRTGSMFMGYLGDPDASSLDDEGYWRTGDLVEQRPDGSIVVVGRVKSAVKMANGEFVSAERVEAALGASPLVDQVFVQVSPGSSILQALVVPRLDPLASLLDSPAAPAPVGPAQPTAPAAPTQAMAAPAAPTQPAPTQAGATLAELVRRPGAAAAVQAELARHGAASGLRAYELPGSVALDGEAFSVERGTLTPSGKLARPGLERRLLALLGPGTQAAREPWAQAASEALGRPVAMDDPLSSLDSLAAAAVLAALSALLGRGVPLDAWFASSTLADLAARLDAGPRASSLEHEARAELARPLDFAPPPGEPRRPARAVLLTGATGFLGIHLLEQLAPSREVHCLVRARDPRHARERIERAARAYRCAIDMQRVHPEVADLERPGLGLDRGAFERLAGAVDAVVHAGAEVSWLAPFARLRGANVEGTRTLIALCGRGIPKRMHLVSTISAAPPGGDERSALTLAQAATSPYALSKWLSERLVLEARGRGLAATLYRPGMIAPHSERGLFNPRDYTARYVEACRELGLYIDDGAARLDMTPVDHVARAVAASLDEAPGEGEVLHLVNVARSMSYAALGQAMEAAGVAVKPASYGRFRAGLLGQRGLGKGLRELEAFFPEGALVLGMGPWPDEASRRWLARLGVTCPPIDRVYVERAVKARPVEPAEVVWSRE